VAEEPDPDEAEVGKLLSWAYRGEVSGETLFERLATHFTPIGRDVQMRRLADLERAMGSALGPLLDERGLTGGDLDRANREATAAADEIGAQPYATFLASFEPVTTAALDRYRRLAVLSGSRHQPVLELLIDHEEALREFARREVAGDGADSLEPVDAVLDRLNQHRPGSSS